MSAITERVQTRAERVEQIRALREEGLTLKQIGEEMGLSWLTIRAYANDPDGTKVRARKNGYRGRCETCGRPTDGSNGAAAAPTRCAACTTQAQHDGRFWTQERVIDAIQWFAREHGRKPKATEWLRQPGCDQDGVSYPWVTVVQREFGTWNAAIEAAGFEAEAAGHYERTPEILEKYSLAQKATWRNGTRKPRMRSDGPYVLFHATITAEQKDALRRLPGAMTENVRLAIDAYLARQVGEEER